MFHTSRLVLILLVATPIGCPIVRTSPLGSSPCLGIRIFEVALEDVQGQQEVLLEMRSSAEPLHQLLTIAWWVPILHHHPAIHCANTSVNYRKLGANPSGKSSTRPRHLQICLAMILHYRRSPHAYERKSMCIHVRTPGRNSKTT